MGIKFLSLFSNEKDIIMEGRYVENISKSKDTYFISLDDVRKCIVSKIVAPCGARGRPGLPDHTDPRGVVLSYIHSCNFLVLFRPYYK